MVLAWWFDECRGKRDNTLDDSTEEAVRRAGLAVRRAGLDGSRALRWSMNLTAAGRCFCVSICTFVPVKQVIENTW